MRRLPFEVRLSTISGQGAFATVAIPAGRRIIEYVGERITPEEADARYKGGASTHPLVLLFSVSSKTVIDAAVGGNEARFINHSCEPNCESVTRGQRIWIYALRAIEVGEELTYDYNLIGDDEDDIREARQYPCHCGAPSCRGTLFKLAGPKGGSMRRQG